MTDQIEYWAESGDWGSGPALVIMRGFVDPEYDGQFYEDVTVMVDQPITDPEDPEEVQRALETHGFRFDCWGERRYSDYGIILTLRWI